MIISDVMENKSDKLIDHNILILIAKAKSASSEELKVILEKPLDDVLISALDNPNLNELDLISLIRKNRYRPETLTKIANHPNFKRSYRVKVALCHNPKTPHRLVLSYLKEIFLFDLISIIQNPYVSPDIKIAAENIVMQKMEEIPLGTKITLAKRASPNILDKLILNETVPIFNACLDNPKLREISLLKAINLSLKKGEILNLIVNHNKWGNSYAVKLALLRHPNLFEKQRLAIIKTISKKDIIEIIKEGKSAQHIIELCQKELDIRNSKGHNE